MDVDGLLQSVVRFSNFMTARLIVSGLVFYILAGFTDIGSSTEGLLPNLNLMNNVIQNYQNIFDILGVSDFALLLIFFLFITAIHLTYVAFERIGDYIPPAIIPLPSWTAIEDLTRASFDILREARGDQQQADENQRLFEFRRKLEAIDAANETEYKTKLASTYNVFRVSKTLIVFTVLAWIAAVVSGHYSGDPVFILVALSLAVFAALYTAVAIYRGHHERILELRGEVTHQLLGFAAIWLPTHLQQRMIDVCALTSDQPPAHFKVLMPVYGTADAFIADYRKWRAKRRGKTIA